MSQSRHGDQTTKHQSGSKPERNGAKTTAAPGKQSRSSQLGKQPRPAMSAGVGIETQGVKETRSLATSLAVQAQIFRTVHLPSWQGALDSLQPDAVLGAAQTISAAWRKLSSANETLEMEIASGVAAASPNGMGAGDLMPPTRLAASDRPMDPRSLPQVERAGAQFAAAHRDVGRIVSLQKLAGQTLLGRTYSFDVGADPARFILARGDEAATLMRAVREIALICANPAGETDYSVAMKSADPATKRELGHTRNTGRYISGKQRARATTLIVAQDSRLKHNFLREGVATLGHRARWDEIVDDSSSMKTDDPDWVLNMKAMVALSSHHSSLMDKAVLTKDGRENASVPAERIEEMRADARRITSEVHRFLYASDDKLNSIVNKYRGAPRELDMFFSLLERENVIDAMLKRGDSNHITRLLDSTIGHKGRRYNESLDSSMTAWQSSGMIAAEAGRQTPGAVCHLASGVFDGLSHVPGLGKVFAKSASGFRDLAKVADDATGADNDKFAKKWRNRIAYTAGMVDSALLQAGVSAQVNAVKGAGAAYTAASVAENAGDARRVAELFLELEDMYKKGGMAWAAGMSAVAESGELLANLRHGDWAGALDSVDTVFDGMIDAAGSILAGKWTGKTAAEKQARLTKRENKTTHLRAQMAFRAKLMSISDPSKVTPADTTELAKLGAATLSPSTCTVSVLERDEPELPTAAKAVSPKGQTPAGHMPVATGNSPAKKVDGLKASLWAKLKETLVKIFIWMLKLVKTALKEAIKSNIVTARMSASPPSKRSAGEQDLIFRLGQAMVTKVDAAAPQVSAFAVGLLHGTFNKLVLTPLVMSMLRTKWPQLAVIQPHIETGLGKLIGYGMRTFEVDKAFAAPVRNVGRRVTTKLLSAVGGSATLEPSQ